MWAYEMLSLTWRQGNETQGVAMFLLDLVVVIWLCSESRENYSISWSVIVHWYWCIYPCIFVCIYIYMDKYTDVKHVKHSIDLWRHAFKRCQLFIGFLPESNDIFIILLLIYHDINWTDITLNSTSLQNIMLLLICYTTQKCIHSLLCFLLNEYTNRCFIITIDCDYYKEIFSISAKLLLWILLSISTFTFLYIWGHVTPLYISNFQIESNLLTQSFLEREKVWYELTT